MNNYIWRLVIALIAATMLLPGSGCKTTSKQQTAKAQVSDEIRIGRNLMAGVLGTTPLLQNEPLQQYLNQVGRWIALQSERPDLPWTFALVDSPAIFAAAAPGGYIAVSSGWYELLENEDQLAALLARQISHVTGQHHLNALRTASSKELMEKLASRAKSKKQQKRLQTSIQQAMPYFLGGLDAGYDFAADRQGATLAARAGYDPYAALDVLATLASIAPADPNISLYLNSHASLLQRIQTLDQLLAQYMPELSLPKSANRLRSMNQNSLRSVSSH